MTKPHTELRALQQLAKNRVSTFCTYSVKGKRQLDSSHRVLAGAGFIPAQCCTLSFTPLVRPGLHPDFVQV